MRIFAKDVLVRKNNTTTVNGILNAQQMLLLLLSMKVTPQPHQPHPSDGLVP
jgi:hypothetical protein